MHHKIEPIPREPLTEFDFGQWEGLTFGELASDRQWTAFNTTRATVRPPNGESILEVQTRVVLELETIRRRHEREMVAVVSHADVIRSALAFYLGLHLDHMLRFVIHEASVSAIRFDGDIPLVLFVNRTEEIRL